MEVTVALLNMFGAVFAAGCNIWGAYHSKNILRFMFNIVAGFALVFAIGYGWLVFNLESQHVFADVFRPVSIWAWLAAWAWPPWAIVTYMRSEAERVHRETLDALNAFLEHQQEG